MSSSREDRSELAAHQPRTQNANSHLNCFKLGCLRGALDVQGHATSASTLAVLLVADLFHPVRRPSRRAVPESQCASLPWWRSSLTLSLFCEISGQALRGGSAKLLKNWWTWSGSNRRPLPCHGSALPAAPQAHALAHRMRKCSEHPAREAGGEFL